MPTDAHSELVAERMKTATELADKVLAGHVFDAAHEVYTACKTLALGLKIAIRAATPTTNNVEPRELASGHFHVWKEKWKDGSMIGQECFCGAERDVKQSAQNDTAKPAGDGGITKLYHELLYQVATKHPGETRHETALRYIRNAERGSNQTQASQSGDDNEGAAPEKRKA